MSGPAKFLGRSSSFKSWREENKADNVAKLSILASALAEDLSDEGFLIDTVIQDGREPSFLIDISSAVQTYIRETDEGIMTDKRYVFELKNIFGCLVARRIARKRSTGSIVPLSEPVKVSWIVYDEDAGEDIESPEAAAESLRDLAREIAQDIVVEKRREEGMKLDKKWLGPVFSQRDDDLGGDSTIDYDGSSSNLASRTVV